MTVRSNAGMEGSHPPVGNQPGTTNIRRSSGTKSKRIDPHEKVKRGLSFGPIKGGRRFSTTSGVLKGTKGSPPPPARRTRSVSHELDLKEEDLSKTTATEAGSGRAATAAESTDEEDTGWSSGDELSRGRDPEVKDLPNVDRSNSISSQPEIVIHEPPAAGQDSNSEVLQRTTSKKFHVHPNTNFDKPVPKPTNQTMSPPSPTLSEEEELEATQRAQGLPIYSSPQDTSVTHRAIQTLVRGDFSQMQYENRQDLRRLRTYMTAMDLSGEAAFALEWTIGTVMRDGDTLYAVYAVDEDVGTGKVTDGLPVGQGAASIQDTVAVADKMTAASQKPSFMSFASPLSVPGLRPGSRKSSAATSTDSRALTIAQQERLHALQTLQQTALGLLRKTGLQCRVVIEVIHCKSPRYMITEAIDSLKPELVIIGSRGRSVLKGVLLGSFSNYVVTKSSRPVMVARKKLSGRKTKIAPPNVRLANNLRPSKRLADATIDLPLSSSMKDAAEEEARKTAETNAEDSARED